MLVETPSALAYINVIIGLLLVFWIVSVDQRVEIRSRSKTVSMKNVTQIDQKFCIRRRSKAVSENK